MAPDPRRRGRRAKRAYARARRGLARARRGRRGIMGLRGRGIWSWLGGALGLSVMRHVIPDIAGPYQASLDKAVTGGILYVAGLDNMDLVTAGVKEAISTVIDTQLLPRIGIMPKGAVAATTSLLQPMVIT